MDKQQLAIKLCEDKNGIGSWGLIGHEEKENYLRIAENMMYPAIPVSNSISLVPTLELVAELVKRKHNLVIGWWDFPTTASFERYVNCHGNLHTCAYLLLELEDHIKKQVRDKEFK